MQYQALFLLNWPRNVLTHYAQSFSQGKHCQKLAKVHRPWVLFTHFRIQALNPVISEGETLPNIYCRTGKFTNEQLFSLKNTYLWTQQIFAVDIFSPYWANDIETEIFIVSTCIILSVHNFQFTAFKYFRKTMVSNISFNNRFPTKQLYPIYHQARSLATKWNFHVLWLKGFDNIRNGKLNIQWYIWISELWIMLNYVVRCTLYVVIMEMFSE